MRAFAHPALDMRGYEHTMLENNHFEGQGWLLPRLLQEEFGTTFGRRRAGKRACWSTSARARLSTLGC
jgi:hypothetical protein